MAFDKLPPRETIEHTISALKQKGINAVFAERGEDAKAAVLSIIPEGAKIMNMTSMTLSALGLDTEINDSGRYQSVRNKLNSMDRETQGEEMQMLGAAPSWVIGSVHAVTEAGTLMIASRTESQLPAYAYGAAHVIWVIGAQKIVSDLDQGFNRIYQHSYPLEAERALKAYGTVSGVNKILIVNEEITPDRITVILVNEVLGF